VALGYDLEVLAHCIYAVCDWFIILSSVRASRPGPILQRALRRPADKTQGWGGLTNNLVHANSQALIEQIATGIVIKYLDNNTIE